jgi:O-antigen ligase
MQFGPLLVSPFSPTGRRRAAVSADWLACAAVASLPWSTTATAILMTALLVAILLTLDTASIRRILPRPAAYLPLALWSFMGLGMLWASVPWPARLAGLEHFHKLLFIPVLMLHFSRSDQWRRVWGSFAASTIVLLIYSWASFFWPSLTFGNRIPGVPVKDYIYQNMAFALCACMLLYAAWVLATRRRFATSIGCGAIAAAFLASIAYVAASRTTLLSLPVMLLVVGYQSARARGAAATVACFVLLSLLAWSTSSYLHERVAQLVSGTMDFSPQAMTSEAERIEFWKKSSAALLKAPLLGHGTGSIRDVFAHSTGGEKGAAGLVVDNPHNQTLAVGLQGGIVAIALLYMMWIAHGWLFACGRGPVMTFGLLIVLQNVIGSLFNSHLSDFTAGWLYVLGVGILGGATLSQGHATHAGDLSARAHL